ncbi:MAG: hypothetical protein WD490_03775 [Opitutales bacterium]
MEKNSNVEYLDPLPHSPNKTAHESCVEAGFAFARARWLLVAFVVAMVGAFGGTTAGAGPNLTVVVNPYQEVDWEEFEHHKAALHVHTLQSDGYHMLDEVARAYQEAGFTILAITDHDIFEPNRQISWGNVAEGKGTHLPEDPRPENYPANTTWEWSDYEAPSPDELNILGIEAAELTSQHHMNSFFSSYGVMPGDDLGEDEQLSGVGELSGVVFLDHPGISADWWTRRPIEWYVERFENHSPGYLLGMEVTNAPAERVRYDVGLWDQLLARFMPERPIWGFGTDDMHNLASVRESDSVFVLDELSKEAVREAMERGQFYFRWSSRVIDFREGRGTFPSIQRIAVDNEEGTISIEASDYDEIRWISMPQSLEMVEDYETSNEPWALGRVVQTGPTLNYRETPGVSQYVRVELHRTQGDDVFRTFTNPFGLRRGNPR